MIGLEFITSLLCIAMPFFVQLNFVFYIKLLISRKFIKSLNVDKNIMMLYLHQISLSDNKTSEAILDTLCMQTTDNNKRMFYFYILNDVVKNADGALAELLGAYCIKYVNENTDYALEYFSNHRDISNHYAQMIAAELYFNDISITDYKRTLRLSVKGKSAKDYLSVFLNIIEQNQRGLSISGDGSE